MTTNTPPARPLACITGASSGIGAAFARRLAREGFDLLLVARRKERLENLAEEIRREQGVQARTLAADLGDLEALRALEGELAAMDRLELLVNNAGFGLKGSFAEIEAAEAGRMLDVHSRATIRLTRAVLPGMIRRGRGAVITVSSLAAFLVIPGSVIYCATKAFLNAFTEGLSMELAGTGVRVQALCPGLTRTGFHAAMKSAPQTNFSLLWMSADAVARSSLAALRRGKVIHVPGLVNRLLLLAATLVPRGLYRTLASRVIRREAAETRV